MTIPPNIHDISLLIVDDEPGILSLLTEISNDIVRSVNCCSSGEDALEFIKNNEVEIAVIDIRMPSMDGITLLREIKKLKPALAIIIHSGYFNSENMRIAVQFNVFDILSKPCDIDDYRFSLGRCIEKVKTERILNEILETLLFETTTRLTHEDFLKLSAEARAKILAGMLGVLKSRQINKKIGVA